MHVEQNVCQGAALSHHQISTTMGGGFNTAVMNGLRTSGAFLMFFEPEANTRLPVSAKALQSPAIA